jgi:hypothetical protein
MCRIRGRGQREEMVGRRRVDLPLVHEFQIRLMDQGRRVHRARDVPAPPLPVGKDAEFRVDEGVQLVQRLAITMAHRL